MLTIIFTLPEICESQSKSVDVCAEIDDDTIYIRLKACAQCKKMFHPIRVDHRFCYRGRCRRDFHEGVRHFPSGPNSSNP